MRTDRQTDVTKLIVAFRNLANTPKKWLDDCGEIQGYTLEMGDFDRDVQVFIA
jgi:hypothetical protein